MTIRQTIFFVLGYYALIVGVFFVSHRWGMVLAFLRFTPVLALWQIAWWYAWGVLAGLVSIEWLRRCKSVACTPVHYIACLLPFYGPAVWYVALTEVR
jgi:hypothetical protein